MKANEIKPGVLYHAYDEELLEQRKKVQEALKQMKQGEEQQVLKELLGSWHDDCEMCVPFHFDYGENIFVGHRFHANFNAVFLDEARITFGYDCLIGPNCGFYTASHPLDSALRDQMLETCAPITVGSHVWFGGNCVVLGGVTIGDHAVIGAGSVVTKDIPPYALAYGNPCRVIRMLASVKAEER